MAGSSLNALKALQSIVITVPDQSGPKCAAHRLGDLQPTFELQRIPDNHVVEQANKRNAWPLPEYRDESDFCRRFNALSTSPNVNSQPPPATLSENNPTPVPDTSSPPRLTFKGLELLATGRQWDVYLANANTSVLDGRFIVKFLRSDSGWGDNRENEREQGLRNWGAAKASIFVESGMYLRPLKELQGTIVPHFFGLFYKEITTKWGNKVWLWISVMEYCGSNIDEYGLGEAKVPGPR